jgi:hypothetical protein
MHRLIVALLAAVDAAIAVAVGLAATLAPLTVLWVFALGGTADWNALWPASAVIWQFGNLVPLAVTIPAEYIAAVGIDPDAASFTLSLAPLLFASFTAIFAARSGARASHADAWLTGVAVGSLVVAALSTLVALTSTNGVASVHLWQAVLIPTLVFALPALIAAVVTEWREAGAGFIARLRDRIETAEHGWGDAPGLIARGAAVVLVGLVGLGALLTVVGLILRGGQIIALYEAAHLDALGATVVTLAQLAYLPTMIVWALTFIAGPGFAVGAGTSVSPAGTQVGVVPGIPLLGIVPDSTTPWLLLLALLPIGLGALAGWIARSRLTGVGAPANAGPRTQTVHAASMDASSDASRTSALAGLLAASTSSRESELLDDPQPTPVEHEPIGARLVITLGIALLSAAGAAILAAVASGSMGPGRLAVMGPSPGPVALAVGVEVIVGAGILLLAPRAHKKAPAAARTDNATTPHDAPGSTPPSQESAPPTPAPPPADHMPDAVTEELPIAPARLQEPFTFPTVPRIPGSTRGEGGGSAPVD